MADTLVEPVDDNKVMALWRLVGLPEYFLGNGGTNTKLVRFARAVAADETERLSAEVARLSAELEVARRDALRYRWIRTRNDGSVIDPPGPYAAIATEDGDDFPSAAELDAAIDAAREG